MSDEFKALDDGPLAGQPAPEMVKAEPEEEPKQKTPAKNPRVIHEPKRAEPEKVEEVEDSGRKMRLREYVLTRRISDGLAAGFAVDMAQQKTNTITEWDNLFDAFKNRAVK